MPPMVRALSVAGVGLRSGAGFSKWAGWRRGRGAAKGGRRMPAGTRTRQGGMVGRPGFRDALAVPPEAKTLTRRGSCPPAFRFRGRMRFRGGDGLVGDGLAGGGRDWHGGRNELQA